MNQSHFNEENITYKCPINNFKHRVYPPTYLVFSVLGLLSNLTSLYFFISLWRRNRGFTTGYLFMVNLLVSDFMLVCSLPFRATYYLMDFNWSFGDVPCRVMSYVFYINMYSSIYFLMVLSITRFLAVMKPYQYKSLENSPFARIVCLFIWLFVSLAAIPLLTLGTVQDSSGRIRCLELNTDLKTDQISILIIVNHVTLFLGFVLPFSVTTICYIFIVRKLLILRRVQCKARQSYNKSCAMVVIVLCLFLACFFPYHVVRTIFLEAERKVSEKGYENSCKYIEGVRKSAVITLCLAAGNSCLDPLLYLFMAEDFRIFYKRKLEFQKKLKAQELKAQSNKTAGVVQ